MTDGVVNIRGKQYQTVAKRVADFRKVHPTWCIITEILESGDVVLMRCSILDEEGDVVATGHAEESRSSSSINKTSAIENCETSAVGRALAFLGLGGDYGIASADEVLIAVQAQGRSGTDQSAPTMGAATDGTVETLIATIERLVEEADSSEPGKALKNLAKTKGAIAWRDLAESELTALASALIEKDADARRVFLNSWAGR